MITPALWRHELRRAPLPVIAAGVLGGVCTVAVTHLLIPRMPATVLTLLETAFRVEGLRALLVLNDHLATWVAVFFTGVALQHAALVGPRADRELPVWLAQPLPAADQLRLRATPTLAFAALAGVASAGATALSVALAPAGGTTTVAGALVGGLAITALALALLAALLPLAAAEDDSFRLLVVSFIAWTAPLLPTSALVYRPDLLPPDGAVARVVALPVSLLWADVGALPWLALGVAALVPWTLGATRWAAARFAAADG